MIGLRRLTSTSRSRGTVRDPCLHGGRFRTQAVLVDHRPVARSDLRTSHRVTPAGSGSGGDESLGREEGLDVLDALGGLGSNAVIGIYWVATLIHDVWRFAGREVACTCQSRNRSAPSWWCLCSVVHPEQGPGAGPSRSRRTLRPDLTRSASRSHMRQDLCRSREGGIRTHGRHLCRRPLSRRVHSSALAPLLRPPW